MTTSPTTSSSSSTSSSTLHLRQSSCALFLCALTFLTPPLYSQANPPDSSPTTTQPLSASPASTTSLAWSAPDLTGSLISASDPNQITLLLFAMPDQEQSRLAIEQIRKITADNPSLRLIAIVSGQDSPSTAQQLASQNHWPHPILPDPAYNLSGASNVHVWPTTLILQPKGKISAHLPGLPSSFSKDLQAHLLFAQGKINSATLEHQLQTHRVIAHSPSDLANRHLQTAQRFLDQSQPDLALPEINKGLAIEPNHPLLQLALARTQLLQSQPSLALQTLNHITPDSLPQPPLLVLRGRALIALNQWPQAQQTLTNALKLNPSPAEAHYLLACVYQHLNNPQAAAQHFKNAFESTPQGKNLKLPSESPAP